MELRGVGIDARFVFIDRDPRSVFNSQRVSRGSLMQTPMQTNPVHFALDYDHAQRCVEKYKGSDFFYVVSYERLLAEEDDQLGRLAKFLGVQYPGDVQPGRYHEKIPESQQHLHRLVGSGRMSKDRMDAWKRELPSLDACFLGLALRKWLRVRAYGPDSSTRLGLRDYPRIAWMLIQYWRGRNLIARGEVAPPYAA